MESRQRPVELYCRLLDPKRDCQLHRSKQTADWTRMATDNVHSRGSEKTEWTDRSYQHSSAERAKRRACIHAGLVAILPIRNLARRIVHSRFVGSWRYLRRIHVAPLPTAN